MLTLTNLICCSIYQKSAYVLSCDKEQIKFPSLNLDNVNIDETTVAEDLIKSIFEKYISLDFNWAKPKLTDIDIYTSQDGVSQTHIYYSCYIPYRTVINDSYWVIADDMLAHSKLLRKALYV
jgi:hypothetical protein